MEVVNVKMNQVKPARLAEHGLKHQDVTRQRIDAVPVQAQGFRTWRD
jgi:hypothetical protein